MTVAKVLSPEEVARKASVQRYYSRLDAHQMVVEIEGHATSEFASLLFGIRDRIDACIKELGYNPAEDRENFAPPMDEVDAILASLDTDLGQFVVDALTDEFPHLDASECDIVNDLCNEMGDLPQKVARKARWAPKK